LRLQSWAIPRLLFQTRGRNIIARCSAPSVAHSSEADAKIAAMVDLNAALEAGWPGLEIAERIPLSEIACAHELVEHPARTGRIVVTL